MKGWINNMNIIKRFAASVLALTLLAGTASVYAQSGTTPGYKLVNSYDESTGTITSSIYVTGGKGSVGQLGLFYDTKLLDVAATVDGELTADYDLSECRIENFVTASTRNSVVATGETNKLENLINEDDGEIFFAWYTGLGKNADATNEDVLILTVKFLVAKGVDAKDLEKSGDKLIAFADDTPSDKKAIGYKSGVLITNELNEYFRNKKSTGEYRITLGVEFEGLDIDETETITIKVLDKDGNPVEGAYVKVGSHEVQTNAQGEASFEVSGEYVVYYKYTESDSYDAVFGETTVEIKAPSKPKITSITKATGKLTVFWSKPESTGGSDITGYIVSYAAPDEAEQTKEIEASATRVVLDGLTGGVEYTVKIKAVNAIGEGEYSDEMKATPSKSEGTKPGGGAAPAPADENYTVTYEVGNNGTIISGSKTEAVAKGKKPAKVPTVKANEGYEFLGWAKTGTEIVDPTTVTINAATTFTAQYKKLVVENPFTDVTESDWYYEYVMAAFEKQLMNGVGETTFDPNGDVTRAMFVTVLYRMDGSPENNGNVKFNDVEKGSWYDKAVAWASQNEIVNGVSDVEFAPNNKITREQMAAMVYRYASYKKADMTVTADISSYTDYATVSSYAVEPMKWVCGKGIINGMTETTLVPQGTSTRAQAATVFVRTIDALSK